MGLIDTHTHLDSFATRGELPSILDRAERAGIEKMVTIGTDAKDWGLYRELARSHAGRIHYTAGLHPCSVEEDWEIQFSKLEEYWSGSGEAGTRPIPVAIGEIGLDRFHLPKDDTSAAGRIYGWQRAAFDRGLALGRKLGCPVVVHSRGAFRDCVDAIDASGVDWARVVFHCFTEGPDEMGELSRRGGVGSFTGIITYKTAEAVRAAAKAQGLHRLMLETDAPYLTPMPHRGKPNEPAFLRHTAEYCAQLFGVGYDELSAVTTANARSFYGI